MKNIFFFTLLSITLSQTAKLQAQSQQEINKEIATNFYKDLWFTNNTAAYTKYMADEYVAHDIGERKGVTEPAIEQKRIADFMWENGNLKSEFDYQIAEGDLVATRWTTDYTPTSLLGKLAMGSGEIPIINVFRIKDGKIVELWNHRHDIDTGQVRKFILQGFFFGLLVSLIPTFFAFRMKRKLKELQVQ
jgi:predicted SnoaL-like aldol condensation-catalyzing enzyme